MKAKQLIASMVVLSAIVPMLYISGCAAESAIYDKDSGDAAIMSKNIAISTAENQALNKPNYNEIGVEAYKRKDYAFAIEAYEKALENDPQNIQTLNNLSLAFYRSGNYSEAKSTAEKVIELKRASDSQKATAYFNLGKTYEALYEIEKARIAYETSNKILPSQLRQDSATRMAWSISMSKKMLEIFEGHEFSDIKSRNKARHEKMGNIGLIQYSDRQKQHCYSIVNALKFGGSIKYPQPFVNTSDYQHPEITKYRDQFGEELNAFSHKLPPGEPPYAYAVANSKANGPFRLYRVDADNNSQNGREIVFYGDDWLDAARFRVLSIKNGIAKEISHSNSQPEVKYEKRINDNFNLIAEFKGEVIFVHIEDTTIQIGKVVDYLPSLKIECFFGYKNSTGDKKR